MRFFPRGVRGCAPSRGAAECRGSPAASKPFPVGTGVRRRPQLQNPHSSSGQTALYSGRPAGEGIPHAASLPLLFPTKPASLGFCGGPYRLRRKEKALFDGVKRKRLGGGIPDFVRNARGACYGGLARWKLSGFAHSTKYGSCESWGPSRILCRSLLLPHSGIRRDPGTVISILPQQQKEERCIRKRPFHQSSATANVRQQKRKPGHPSIPPASETAICS